jgi:hypothetical protein
VEVQETKAPATETAWIARCPSGEYMKSLVRDFDWGEDEVISTTEFTRLVYDDYLHLTSKFAYVSFIFFYAENLLLGQISF